MAVITAIAVGATVAVGAAAAVAKEKGRRQGATGAEEGHRRQEKLLKEGIPKR
jgi:hypothetical protein